MVILRGVLAVVGLMLLMVWALRAGATVGTRVLGLPRFEWFAPPQPGVARWRRAVVRLVSAFAPLVACLVFAWGALVVGGTQASSTTITVTPGPAERAGLRDGDRIVAIDGVAMDSWDAIRATAKPGRGPAHVDVERAGARRGFVIEPGPEGRLGIATQRRNQAVSVGAALQQALAIPGNAYSSALTGIGRATTERGELAGPVALVRASGDQTNSLATIQFLTFYGVWLWPWLAGIHLWDAVTLALFARTHGFALDPERPALLARFCRLYQALGITLVVSTACLVLAGFSQLPLVGAVVLLPLLLLYPCAISLYPLVWLAAKARWQQRSLWIVPAVFVALVPCSALLAGFVLHAWLRRELKAEGLAVSWFGAQPAPVIA